MVECFSIFKRQHCSIKYFLPYNINKYFIDGKASFDFISVIATNLFGLRLVGYIHA